jgi:PadR family transcriptional regulator PadR
MTNYEQGLLDGWEEAYRRGQLTLWCFLALKDGPKHMGEIKLFFDQLSLGSFRVDDQSLYRALRRYNKADLIEFTTQAGDGGPDRKLYQLTSTGAIVLSRFLERNIAPFYASPMKHLTS